jgi:hypothetical protein
MLATLENLARANGVKPPDVCRGLLLTLLAPEIAKAILDGRQPAGWTICWRDFHRGGRGRGGS